VFQEESRFDANHHPLTQLDYVSVDWLASSIKMISGCVGKGRMSQDQARMGFMLPTEIGWVSINPLKQKNPRGVG
jgi:hypothetical protein